MQTATSRICISTSRVEPEHARPAGRHPARATVAIRWIIRVTDISPGVERLGVNAAPSLDVGIATQHLDGVRIDVEADLACRDVDGGLNGYTVIRVDAFASRVFNRVNA